MNLLNDENIINKLLENIDNDEIYRDLKEIIDIRRSELKEEFNELINKMKRE